MQNDDLSKNSETLKNKNLKMGTKYHIKMGKKIIKFGDVELEKHKFHCHKNPIFLNYVNVVCKLVSNKIKILLHWLLRQKEN